MLGHISILHPDGFGAAALLWLTIGAVLFTIWALATSRERTAWRIALVALAFQAVHLSEHLLQLIAWLVNPHDPAWLSPWAGGVAMEIGSMSATLPGSGAASIRGVEALHLLGNIVFLASVVALWWLGRRLWVGRGWTTVALVTQIIHVGEHLLLYATLLIGGMPNGFSTAFGTLTGTELTSHRVIWHFVANLIPTVAASVGALQLWRVMSTRPAVDQVVGASVFAHPPAGRMRLLAAGIPVLLVALVVLPQGVSRAVGESVPAAPGRDVTRPDDPADAAVRFQDVAGEVGLEFEHGAFNWGMSGDPAAMMGGGVCWLDYDRDGWQDLFVVNNWSENERGRWLREDELPRSRLFRNEVGRFVDVTDESGAGLEARGMGCVAADLDGDGWTDLYVTSEWANALLWNDGDATFTEGAEAAGVDAYGWHTAAAAGDVNSDGRPDLVVAGYANRNWPLTEATRGFPNTFQPVRDLLYLGQEPDGDGRPAFLEVGESVGLEAGTLEYGLGMSLLDFDGDGDLDLYVANDTQPNRLYSNRESDNRHGFRLEEIGTEAGVDDENSGMGVAVADFDGQEGTDIFVTNMGDQLHALLAADAPAGSEPRYSDAVARSGIDDLGVGDTGWGAGWGDLDLDTDLDLFVANGGIPLLDRVADAQDVQIYENLTADGEPGALGLSEDGWGIRVLDPLNARGSALADFDNDGDLDVAVVDVGGDLVLLRNSGAGGHWLLVDLGAASAGTRVEVELADGTVLSRQVALGSSYLSTDDARAHFGLGSNASPVDLRVMVPGGEEQVIDAVEVDQIIEVTG